MNLKKILSSVAIVGAIATILGASAMASEIKLVPQGNTTVEPGATVVVDLVTVGNPGLFSLNVSIANDGLVCTNVVPNTTDFLPVPALNKAFAQNPYTINYVDGTYEYYSAFNGSIATLTYTAPETPGTYNLTLKQAKNKTDDLNEESYAFDSITGCSIKVEKAGLPEGTVGNKYEGQYSFYTDSITVDTPANYEFQITKDSVMKPFGLPRAFTGNVTFTPIVLTSETGTYTYQLVDTTTSTVLDGTAGTVTITE